MYMLSISMCFKVFVIRLHLQITYLPYLASFNFAYNRASAVENSNTYTAFNKINKVSCIQVTLAVGVLHVNT